MPIREDVSEELLRKMQAVFRETYNDYRNNRCRSTIALLLVHLYELSLVAFTLHYSSGSATYSFVKAKLPNLDRNQEFVKMRDDIVHNLYNLTDFKKRLKVFLQNFTYDNFEVICKECEVDAALYNELMQYCTLEKLNSF